MWRARHDKKTNHIFSLQLYLCVARLLGSPPLRRRLLDKLISNPGGISSNTFYLSSCSARRQRPRYNTFLPYVRLSPPSTICPSVTSHPNTSVCHPPPPYVRHPSTPIRPSPPTQIRPSVTHPPPYVRLSLSTPIRPSVTHPSPLDFHGLFNILFLLVPFSRDLS